MSREAFHGEILIEARAVEGHTEEEVFRSLDEELARLRENLIDQLREHRRSQPPALRVGDRLMYGSDAFYVVARKDGELSRFPGWYFLSPEEPF